VKSIAVRAVETSPHRVDSLRRRQSGVLSLEVLAVIGVMLFAIMKLGVPAANQWSTNRQDAIAADQFKAVLQGANTFTQNNFATIIAGSNPGTYTWAQIAASMPAGLSATNPFGQTYQLKVAMTGVAPNIVLSPMLQTVGGQPIPENELRAISRLVGGSGGYVSSLTPTVATGAMGGWSATLATWGATPGTGHLAGALFYQNSAQANQYLYRALVPEHPEFNQMKTNIDLGMNSINNADQVNASAVNAVGVAASGVTVTNAGGAVVAMVSGGNTSSVSASGANMFAQTNGSLLVLNNTGSAWAPFQAGTSVVNGGLTVTANEVVGTSLQVNQNVAVGAGLTAGGAIQSSNYVYASGFAPPGGACSPGAIGNSGVSTMVCESGVWQAAGSTPGTICGLVTGNGTTGSLCDGYNPYLGCPPGYARIHWSISQFGPDNELAFCTQQSATGGNYGS
jgi:hypothetical protein